MSKRVSVNNLKEYAQRILEENSATSINNRRVTVTLTRGTAECILTDLEKRGKRLLQRLSASVRNAAPNLICWQ